MAIISPYLSPYYGHNKPLLRPHPAQIETIFCPGLGLGWAGLGWLAGLGWADTAGNNMWQDIADNSPESIAKGRPANGSADAWKLLGRQGFVPANARLHW